MATGDYEEDHKRNFDYLITETDPKVKMDDNDKSVTIDIETESE